jgi:phosphoesterase RecJ-like protein
MFEFAQKLKKLINHPARIIIVIHRNPDGDGVGAALALAEVLEKEKKIVDLICPEPLPKKLQFIPGIEKFRDKFPVSTDANLVIALDCASLEQTGFGEDNFRNKVLVNIDHHPTNPKFGQFNLVNVQASSTCEILYDLFREWPVTLTKSMAYNLMVGIFTDTGGFKHSNTSQKVLKIASELLKYGLNLAKIYKEIYQTKTMPALKLWGLVFERICLSSGLAWAVVTEEDFKRLGASDQDAEGLAEVLANVPQAKMSLLLTEKDGQVKGGLRTSRDDVDVSKFAQILGGGGLKKAAGFRLPGKIEVKGNEVRII